ncbi:hypothetical protein [Vibrio furnissii]|uniref:hypothetical protein n=1 Tax=Vibrio furnissii TaxID=29494 RepID=UPI003AA91626
MDNSAFLTHLKNELHNYHQLDSQNEQAKRERKLYINGMMVAARLLGVSFQVLEEITNNELKEHIDLLATLDQEAILDIPSYLRNKLKAC